MRFAVPTAHDAGFQDYARLFERFEQSSLRLDAQFRIPLTRIHFGWDAVLGLMPIAGDLASASFSVRNMQLAYRLGADARLLCSMALNVIIDVLIGAVPIIGTFFDIWYRANLRNLILLTNAIEAHHQLRLAGDGTRTAD
jgi:hypothetical protein